MSNDICTRTSLLTHELLEGVISAAEAQELNHLLKIHPEARDLYIEITSVHVGLERSIGCGMDEIPIALSTPKIPPNPIVEVKPRTLPSTAWRWIFATCAASLIAICVTLVWMTSFSTQLSAVPTENYRRVATLIMADACHWNSAQEIFEGQRLTAQLLSLMEGTAAIRFDDGAEMVITGPSDVEIRSAASARLVSGKVNLRAENGFKLSTAACDLLDFGTEFAASVDSKGNTNLHVFSGQVAVTKTDPTRMDGLVQAGQAVRISSDGQSTFAIKGFGTSFDAVMDRTIASSHLSELHASESFSYPHGATEPTELDGGFGWSGPWRLRSKAEYAPLHELDNPRLADTNKKMEILKGDLIADGVTEKNGGRLGFASGEHYRLRNLRTPIDMGADGVTYFSLQVRQIGIELPIPDATNSKVPINEDWLRITFRSSGDYWNERLLFGLQKNEFPLVHTFGSGLFESVASVATESSTLWTGKIIRSKLKEDEIFFRIFTRAEDVKAVEPSTWHIVTKGIFMNQAFDTLVITSIGKSKIELDELRIGSTWRDVVGWHQKIQK